MKKEHQIFIIALACLLLNSCAKKENMSDETNFNNRVIPIEAGSKTANYVLSYQVGHLITDCGGSCVTSGGINFHVDCMGNGHYCRKLANVMLQQTGSAITATTTDTFDLTSEDFFLMPDRSLDYMDEKGNHLFLNIPEQLVYRDSATQQFTFTGLFFTDDPEYTNE